MHVLKPMDISIDLFQCMIPSNDLAKYALPIFAVWNFANSWAEKMCGIEIKNCLLLSRCVKCMKIQTVRVVQLQLRQHYLRTVFEDMCICLV